MNPAKKFDGLPLLVQWLLGSMMLKKFSLKEIRLTSLKTSLELIFLVFWGVSYSTSH